MASANSIFPSRDIIAPIKQFRELDFQEMSIAELQPGSSDAMTDLITDIWAGLKDAGMPDVMLYLSDGSACRCHWDETALVGSVRVALLADQDRKIVRIVPIHECKGIGIASPKGMDPAGYRRSCRRSSGSESPAEPGPHLPAI